MARKTPKIFDVIECYDIYQEMKDAQWLIQSMKDATSIHWDENKLIDHLTCLLSAYEDQIKEIMPRLDAAFDKALPNDSDESQPYSIRGQN
jgi:hypothetical protein